MRQFHGMQVQASGHPHTADGTHEEDFSNDTRRRFPTTERWPANPKIAVIDSTNPLPSTPGVITKGPPEDPSVKDSPRLARYLFFSTGNQLVPQRPRNFTWAPRTRSMHEPQILLENELLRTFFRPPPLTLQVFFRLLLSPVIPNPGLPLLWPAQIATWAGPTPVTRQAPPFAAKRPPTALPRPTGMLFAPEA